MTDEKGKPGSFQKRKGRKLICNLRVQRVFSSVRRCLLRRAACPPPFPYPCVAGGAAIALPTSAPFRAFFQLRVDCICDQQKKKRGKEAIKRSRFYSFFFSLFSFFPHEPLLLCEYTFAAMLVTLVHVSDSFLPVIHIQMKKCAHRHT